MKIEGALPCTVLILITLVLSNNGCLGETTTESSAAESTATEFQFAVSININATIANESSQTEDMKTSFTNIFNSIRGFQRIEVTNVRSGGIITDFNIVVNISVRAEAQSDIAKKNLSTSFTCS